MRASLAVSIAQFHAQFRALSSALPVFLVTLAALVGPRAALVGPGFALLGPHPALAQDERAADPEGEWLDVDVATVGVDLATGHPLALVHEGWAEVLPIWIGQAEAEAILRALRDIPVPRPMTHDLMASLLGGLDAELVEVRIHDLRGGTYFGTLLIRRDGDDDLTEIDTRPSDGLALAVRTGARIRVARQLLEGAADPDFVSSEGGRSILRLRGVTVADPTEADIVRLERDDASGLVVLHAAAGTGRFEPGDLIVAVDGNPVRGAPSYLNAIRRAPGSTPLTLTVIREGEELELRLLPRREGTRFGD